MSIIRKVERPRPGMYLLKEDISLDGTRKRAVAPGDTSARFVLGVAGAEVPATLITDITNVEIKDQRVSVARAGKSEPPEPVTTGTVVSRGESGAPAGVVVTPEEPSVTEGSSSSAAALDESTVSQTADKPKKAEGK